LTPIGSPAPNLYVADEVANNRFRICGGRPGGRVSWQVTGIRKDPYAETNRIQVEEEKPESKRGFYLHPTAYGKSKEMSIPVGGANFLQSPAEGSH
jgi:hypothetical protein